MSAPDDPQNEPAGQPTIAWRPEDLAEAGQDPLVGTLLRGKWRVLERIGAGSFGTVYKVQDVKGGWVEALKILSVGRLTGAEAENMRARFLREARIMKRLGTRSSHIVGLSTYEEDLESGLVYFLMELVEGRSFGAALRDEGPFDVERTARIALQVCDALTAAHEGTEPVVHRDLKLENLMLTTDSAGAEMAKVLDFGIAKIVEREPDSRLTAAGTLGTPGYAAPEQLRAEEVDARTDLFAFGVILYALLTGRDPWLGRPAHEPTQRVYDLMVAAERAEMIPLEQTGVRVPPGMARIVTRLLQRDPAERFQSARALREALERLASGEDMEPDAERGAPARRPSRGGAIVVGGGLLAIALGAVAVYVQPLGRTLAADELRTAVARGNVSAVALVEGGLDGVMDVGPLASPFHTPLAEGLMPEAVERLRAAGVFVDTSREVRRLTELAREAQARTRYFGLPGGDVVSYALRLERLEPGNPVAASLLLKVGERLAWDADAALREGSPERARTLVDRCLELVPGHARCTRIAAGL